MFNKCAKSIIKALALYQLLNSDNFNNKSKLSKEVVDNPSITYVDSWSFPGSNQCFYSSIGTLIFRDKKSTLETWSHYVRAYPRGPFVNWEIGGDSTGKPMYTEDSQFTDERFYDHDCLSINITDCYAIVKMNFGRIVGCDEKYFQMYSKKCAINRIPYEYHYYLQPKERSRLNVLLDGNDINYKKNIYDVDITSSNGWIVKTNTTHRHNISSSSNTMNLTWFYTNVIFRNTTKTSEDQLQKTDIKYTLRDIQSLYILAVVAEKHREPIISLSRTTFQFDIEISQVFCFTEAITYYPTKVIINTTSNPISLDISDNGYYWCTTKDYGDTNKVLYIKNLTQTANIWAIMINTTDSTVFKMNVTKEDQNRIFLNSGIGKIDDTMERLISNFKIKRVYYDGRILFHVTFDNGFNPYEDIKFNDIIYQRNVYGCNSSHLTNETSGNISLMPIGKTFSVINSSKSDRIEYECVGDFTKGVLWKKSDTKTHSNDTLTIFKKDNINKDTINEALNFIDSIQSKTTIKSSIPQDLKVAIDKLHMEPEMGGKFVIKKQNVSLAIIENEKFSVSTVRVIRPFNESFPSSMLYNNAYGNLGSVLSSLGRLQEAEAAFHEALRHRPNMADVHYNLGVLLQGRRQYEEAIQSFERAIHFRPSLALAYVNMGTSLAAMGRCSAAGSVLARGARLEGAGLRDARAHAAARAAAMQQLGALHAAQGKPRRALQAYHSALKAAPPDYHPQKLYVLMSEAFTRLQKWTEADRYRRAALAAALLGPQTHSHGLRPARGRVKSAENRYRRSLLALAEKMEKPCRSMCNHTSRLLLGDLIKAQSRKVRAAKKKIYIEDQNRLSAAFGELDMLISNCRTVETPTSCCT